MEIVIDKETMDELKGGNLNACPFLYQQTIPGMGCVLGSAAGLGGGCNRGNEIHRTNECPLKIGKTVTITIKCGEAKGEDMGKMKTKDHAAGEYPGKSLYLNSDLWGVCANEEQAEKLAHRYNKIDEIVERLTKCLNAEGAGIDYLELTENPEYIKGARETMQDVLDMINPPPDPPAIVDGVATRDIKKGEKI